MQKLPGWVEIAVAIGIALSPMLPAPLILALAGLGCVGLLVAYRRRGSK
jgi:hypothetical protein